MYTKAKVEEHDDTQSVQQQSKRPASQWISQVNLYLPTREGSSSRNERTSGDDVHLQYTFLFCVFSSTFNFTCASALRLDSRSLEHNTTELDIISFSIVN